MKNLKRRSAKEDFILDSTCLSNKRHEYNGLIDPNLTSFFSSPHRRKLLKKQKLVIFILDQPNRRN